MAALRQRISRLDAADFAAWAVPLTLILYLALSNGGYDPISRGVVGVAVWWAVLVGTALNIAPRAGANWASRLTLVGLAAFAGWTALALTWTESDERTATELARVSAYLGIFTLALMAQGARRGRHVLHGVTAGIAIVCGLAVLSRMHPSWFPEQIAGQYLPGIRIESRLAYPLNYPSALGAFAAIGLPLILAATTSARSALVRALAAGAIPIVALTLWLTTSSLSLPAAVIGLVVFLALAPDRLPKLTTLVVAGAGSAVLFYALEQRSALDRGVPTPEAEGQGDELLAILALVCAGVALVQVGLDLWLRRGRPGWLQVSRRNASIALAGTVIVALTAALAAGGPGWLEDRWDQFKSRGGSASPEEARGTQLLDFSGSGRYDFWQSAVDAFETEPLVGIGPGTFDLWWARTASYPGYTRDAHSLYVETLAELGIVGLVLIGGLSAAVLLIGGWRALRAPPGLRLAIAAATAGCAAFIAAALVDWMWELGVLGAIFFILAAIACAAGAEHAVRSPSAGPFWRRHSGRIATVALSLAGLAAIAQPLLGAVALERSYDAVADGRYDDALDSARDAASVQPYSATAHLQQASLLERRGDLEGATAAAREATELEPTNWLTWFELSRLERESGHSGEAAAARREAKSLNRVSPIPPG